MSLNNNKMIMKNITTKVILSILAVFTIFISIVSCSDDDQAGGGNPSVENVSKAYNDSLVEQGYAGEMYIIRGKGFTGTQKIYFNDIDTYFNSTLITDDVIFVTINRNTPYENASNELKIVTKTGSVIYPFVVAPPAPGVDGFQPVNAAAGDIVTIKGSFFLDPVVKFGDIPATVISSTLTEIKVQLPEGAEHTHAVVSTISGTTKSWEAVGTAIYDDAWYFGWSDEGANVSYITDPLTPQGQIYLKSENGAWSGNQFHDVNWSTLDITGYEGIRFYIKGEAAGRAAIILNGNWADDQSKIINVTTEWTKVELPWSSWPFAITGLQTFVIKEFEGTGNVYHIDSFGFTLNGE
jgi:hypothetical protein